MLKRYATVIALSTILLMILNPIQSRAAAKTNISFYAFGELAEKAAYQTLVAAFNQKYPDIGINLAYTPGEDEFHSAGCEYHDRSRLILDLAYANMPDVF